MKKLSIISKTSYQKRNYESLVTFATNVANLMTANPAYSGKAEAVAALKTLTTQYITKKKSIHLLLWSITLLLLSCSITGNAQNTFLQVLNITTTSMTTDEQTKLTNITQHPEVLNYWHISTDNFENTLNGRILQVALPNEAVSTFEADFPYSEQPGSYYWMGYNLDGSYFQIIKRANETTGKIYIAATGHLYGLISLSSTKRVLVRYDDNLFDNNNDCAVIPSEIVDDDTVEDREGCEINNIRVLFLFTPSIADYTPSPLSASLNVIAETNATCMASGLSETNVHFESAGTVLLPGFIENSNIHDDLDDLYDNTTAKNLRDSYFADIVVLFTAGHSGSTIGTAGGTTNAKAYCVAEISASIAGFTATHEIGHLLGARHQRKSTCDVDGYDNWTWHHGFQVGSTMRTMMVQNTCPNPTRIARWSNPDKDFMGFSTGNTTNNNSKKITNSAGKVCCFRDEPPTTGGSSITFLASISGPSEVCNTQGYYPYQSTIAASPEIVYPLSYVWEISDIGVGNYTQVSTGNSWVLMNPSTLPGAWTTLRLTVTDAANHTAQGFYEIHRISCFGVDKEGEDRASFSIAPIVLSTDGQVSVIPNPADEFLLVTGIMDDSQITIFDVTGRITNVTTTNKTDDGKIQISLNGMCAGLYYISIKNPLQQSSIKIPFVKI